MTKYVLDASAVLALLNRESGAEKVAAVLSESAISSVNYCEAIGKQIDTGVSASDAHENIELLGIEVVVFDVAQAHLAATLKQSTKSLGLSLGDRSCLALALSRKYTVVTAERAWSKLKISLKILLIR